MVKEQTAEEKLLKMIQESSGGEGDTKTVHPDSGLKKKATKRKTNSLSIVKLSNKILILGIIVAIVILFNHFNDNNKLMTTSVDVSGMQDISKKIVRSEFILPIMQRLSFYVSGISGRNIFQPFETKEIEILDNEGTKTSRTIVKKTRNFRLVGVSWLNTVDSASAMIEDTNKKVTYFLRKGEKVGDVTVKTIYADSVELSYQNEEIIIRYDKTKM